MNKMDAILNLGRKSTSALTNADEQDSKSSSISTASDSSSGGFEGMLETEIHENAPVSKKTGRVEDKKEVMSKSEKIKNVKKSEKSETEKSNSVAATSEKATSNNDEVNEDVKNEENEVKEVIQNAEAASEEEVLDTQTVEAEAAYLSLFVQELKQNLLQNSQVQNQIQNEDEGVLSELKEDGTSVLPANSQQQVADALFDQTMKANDVAKEVASELLKNQQHTNEISLQVKQLLSEGKPEEVSALLKKLEAVKDVREIHLDLNQIEALQKQTLSLLGDEFAEKVDEAFQKIEQANLLLNDKVSIPSFANFGITTTDNVINSLPSSVQDLNNMAQNMAFKAEEMKSVHKQILDQMGVSIRQNENRAELRLSPPEWGKINIQMKVENQTELKIHLIAENPNVKQILEQSVQELKQSMNSGGLGFANINVGVGGESTSLFKDREETKERDNVIPITRKVSPQTPKTYRWVGVTESGVDQLV